MKRKQYEKPSVGVVVLQHTGMLMASPASPTVEDYNWQTEDEEARYLEDFDEEIIITDEY